MQKAIEQGSHKGLNAYQNLQLIVRSGRVHGGYSTFNILWHAQHAIVIDFPQVMEFDHSPNANAFLERDVRCTLKTLVSRHFDKAESLCYQRAEKIF